MGRGSKMILKSIIFHGKPETKKTKKSSFF